MGQPPDPDRWTHDLRKTTGEGWMRTTDKYIFFIISFKIYDHAILLPYKIVFGGGCLHLFFVSKHIPKVLIKIHSFIPEVIT